MKKLFIFAAAALALAACSNEELNVQDNVRANSKEAPVSFDVYAQRGMTRGGTPGTIDNKNIGKIGFGVFAYYTAGEQYDAKATPNFMYNQQVKLKNENDEAKVGSEWVYEPVKYWPNEFGAKAESDEVDYVTFFAYAPWTQIDPTTGIIVPQGADADAKKHDQNYNIISVNKNTATGDPIIKYVVDTDPKTSVDLLWGVAAEDADKVYTAIDKPGQNANVGITAGMPFLSLVKPNNPQSDRLMFNLKHALAKVKVTIDYIADDFTPAENYNPVDPAKKINLDETRIYVRNFKMSGFATKGALNLNNTTPGEPLWKDFDGAKDLAFDDVTFQDGRKDGKEGETNGTQNNEAPQGLNPLIIENFCATAADATTGKIKFGATKNPGVLETPQLLFGGTADPQTDNGFFYVIPRNEEGGKVDITIAYDVETIDEALAGKLSDNETHGISIENVITKADIFGGMDFKAGYQYEINIHLGMTSVKVEATVTDWKDNGATDVELPDNQEPYMEYYWKIGDVVYTSDPTEFVMSTDRIYVVDDEGSFNTAYAAGPLKDYYTGTTYDLDPVTGVPSWRGLSTVKHNPAAGFGLPWIVFDTKYEPGLKGDIQIMYNNTIIYDFGAITSLDGNKTFLIMDGTDLGQNAPATSYLTWDDATNGPWKKPDNYTRIKASDFKVTLKRSDVKKYSYTTGAEVTNP